MKTLKLFASKPETVPATTSWYLADLGEAKGRQELFTMQSPQRLKALKEHALIESAVSSNRIEGVTVDQSRIRTVILGKAYLQDRDEEEVRGYKNALNLIHEQNVKLQVSEETVLMLHKFARGDIWDAGQYKDKDSDIIEKYPDGRVHVRFKTVSAAETPIFMSELINLWHQCLLKRWTHPLIALSAFNLDFLCIHPFRDGNGRVSRLLLLLQCYLLGYEAGRYISFERIIEQNKERYYETLAQSSHRWHEGKHDPWPYINYILYTLKSTYKEFEERLGKFKSPKGAKTDIIKKSVSSFTGDFCLADLVHACPGVSKDMIRKVLLQLKQRGEVVSLGRGPGALWRKKGNTLKRG